MCHRQNWNTDESQLFPQLQQQDMNDAMDRQTYCAMQWVTKKAPLKVQISDNSHCYTYRVCIKKFEIQIEVKGEAVDYRLIQTNNGMAYPFDCRGPNVEQLLERLVEKVQQRFNGNQMDTTGSDLACSILLFTRSLVLQAPLNVGVKAVVLYADNGLSYTSDWATPPTGAARPTSGGIAVSGAPTSAPRPTSATPRPTATTTRPTGTGAQR